MAYSGAVPDTAARRLDWMARMACRDKRDLFDDPTREYEARTVCIAHCPVRKECLAHVKRLETGVSRDKRDGVVAGLTWQERWRLDVDASGHSSDKPPLDVSGEPPRCGTYTAFLRHLWLGERIDPECWSAEVRRERLNKVSLAAKRCDGIAEAS